MGRGPAECGNKKGEKMWADDENVKKIQEKKEIQGFRVGTGGLVWLLREEFEDCGMRLSTQ